MQQFSAAGGKRSEVEIVGGGVARVELVGELDDGVVERLPGPGGVVEQEVLHVLGAEGVRGGGAEEDGPLGFGAELEVGEDEGLVGVDVVVVDVVEGGELRGGEAGGGVGGGGAEEGVVVEGAGSRGADDAVGEAVDGVALAKDFGADGGEEGGGDVCAGVGGEVVRAEFDGPGLQVGGPPGGGAGEDAVEGGGVELDFF